MAEGFQKTALKIVNDSIDSFKVWLNDFAMTTESSPVLPKSGAHSFTNGETLSMPEVSDSIKDDVRSNKHNNDSAVNVKPFGNNLSTSLLLRNVTKSPLVKRLKNYMTSSNSKQDTTGHLCNNESAESFSYSDISSANTQVTEKSQTSTIMKKERQKNPGDQYAENVRIVRNKSVETANKISTRTRHKNCDEHRRNMNSANQYNRQDSGYDSRRSFLWFDFNTDLPAVEENDDESKTCRISDLLEEPYQNRDKYRCIARPFIKAKDSCSGNSLDKNIVREYSAKKKVSQKTPKLKMSIQYFQKSKQLRVTLTHLQNIDTLCDNKSKVFAKVCLMPGNRQQKKTKTIRTNINPAFSDCMYFRVKDEDELQEKQLRITIMRKQRLLKKNKVIGEIIIPLKGFDFTFDTLVWCQIKDSKLKHRRNSAVPLFEIAKADGELIPKVIL